jgi:putative transposase
MSNKRKVYTAEFKTKVVLEVLRNDQTITQLSVEYSHDRERRFASIVNA